MVKGIGTDIIEIERIRQSIKKHGQHFLDTIFTPQEQAYCKKHKDPTPHYAGRFAAKEAIIKSLGAGFGEGYTWLDMEIENNPKGQPRAHFSENLNQLFDSPKILLSISHCKAYAVATAVWI